MHVFNSWNDDAVSDQIELLKTHVLREMIRAYGKLSVPMDGRCRHFQLLCLDSSNRVLRNESRKTDERKGRGSKKPGLGECQCINEYYLVLFSSIIVSIVSSIIVIALSM